MVAGRGRRFRPQSRRYKLVSLNVNGMEAKDGTITAAKGSAIIESIAQQLRARRKDAPVAFALQETWMTSPTGQHCWEKEHIGCLFIYSGESTRPALGRQGRGVALVLGPKLQRAWRASGSRILSSGPRHLVIDFRLHGKKWVLGSAYGPSGDTPADQVERDDLFTTLGSAVGGAAERKVLLIGVDANVSVGPDTSSAEVSFDNKASWRAYQKPCGKFGLKRGKLQKRDAFLGLLRSQGWCLANTFFPGPSQSKHPIRS